MQIRRIVLVSAWLATFPAVASAHPIQGVGDFYAGVLHPLTSLNFILPLIALALFAGQQRREAAIAALGAFPMALMASAAAIFLIYEFSKSLPRSVEWLGPAVMSVTGICIALSWRAPTMAAAALFTVNGFILGSIQGLAVRVVGSWVAATGFMVMALARNQAPR